LNRYSVAFPANAIVYGELLINLIEFTAINPRNLIKLVYPLFSVAKILNGVKNGSDEEKQSVLMDLY